MTDEHESADEPAYDPTDPTPPVSEPPRRSTAPQSDYTMAQVGAGVVVLLVGLAITFGLPFVLA